MTDMRMALAGNPNAGKTTIFNALTGSRRHVGNYPGITVEKKTGQARRRDVNITIADLPGTYSLTAYTMEEVVARDVLADERPDVVIDVVNAAALERNLYLTVQLLEMGAPVALALNMMDEARAMGLSIDARELSRRLRLPVVETVGRRGQGIAELLDSCVADVRRRGGAWNEPLRISYGPDLDPALQVMEERIREGRLLEGRYPPRWVALKLLENDADIRARCRQADAELTRALEALTEEAGRHLQLTLDTCPEAVVADYRYGFIAALLRDGVARRTDDTAGRMLFSDKLDAVLTHRFVGPLLLLAVLLLVYEITFVLGAWPMRAVESAFALLKDFAGELAPEGLFRSLLVSGVIDGVGGVMTFVPLIMLIFFQIAFLEDSGYMARMAYMLDRVFRMFGLHGCSVMPFIVGGGIAGGCAVPGVLAARTLRSPREKLATLLTVPFMACGAKLPLFILFVGVFFPGNEAGVMFLLTLAGWCMALLVARLLRSTVIRGESTPFVMELPPYRRPTWRGLCIHAWERTWDYLKKAGTIILAISVLLWAGMTFPRLEQAALEEDPAAQVRARLEHSFAGRLGRALEPLTLYAGFDWRADIALIGGFAAKEVIVATLGTAYSLGDAGEEDSRLAERIAADPRWNRASAVAFMLFVLLYAPCIVTVVCIARETGSVAWALFSLGFNTLAAFGAAVGIYQAGRFFL